MFMTRFAHAVRCALRARRTLGAAMGLALFFTASAAEASLIGWSQGSPDIASSPLLSYDSTANTLTATLTAGNGTYFPGAIPVTNLDYSLSANVDDAGAFSGGTVTLTGAVPGLGIAQGTLLTGILTAFGFDFSVIPTFDFSFDTTFSAAGLNFGQSGGIILTAQSIAATDFTADFSGIATSDTFAAPEPATLALLAFGSIGVMRRRMRRA
jgi:hypothetical protein